ncbi:polysaccharide pyruvyl transferase family protein [Pseudoalteromonas pernae]|uniref:polysaccharide pyruvyl transferase family protein n=1 Tax=Pseudoalteromonas pernae TaxID=3118054 RepID=UPI003242DDD0
MNILVIGQCSLHWGRMEFGNIGNYYIMEPFFRGLHKAFPGASIKTTMQMSERFQKDENVQSVSLDAYYNWRNDELSLAKEEYEQAKRYLQTGQLEKSTPYLELVIESDLVIDFSGDIWGDNADFLGPDRFEVGLYKDLIAQELGKKVIMLAGSPGPFSNIETLELAKTVYSQFDLVTNREEISTELLESWGFDTSKTYSLACPAFLFEPQNDEQMKSLLVSEGLSNKSDREKPIVGFIVCGWNFSQGPFDLWPRESADYLIFAKTVEYLTETLGARVCLMSHSNGFDIPPAPFKLKHGRDYPIAKQLEAILIERDISKDFFVLDGIYDAWQSKSIIASFDMLVTGRVHAAVSGFSQYIPTVVFDYGHAPKAHKLRGFSRVAAAENYLVDPSNLQNVINTVDSCFKDRDSYSFNLKKQMTHVREQVAQHFELTKRLFD